MVITWFVFELLAGINRIILLSKVPVLPLHVKVYLRHSNDTVYTIQKHV